jgi:predicted DNA-binding transcriptional regulator AlpA
MNKRLRFRDLVERRIVNNRPTLQNWIRKNKFPAGQLTGPNTRTWDEAEVEEYLSTRPTAPKPAPSPKAKEGA